MIRQPVAAGQFYPSDKVKLEKLIESLRPKNDLGTSKIKACILPHAGYPFSGEVAAHVLAQIEPTAYYIILGPNHTGYGAPFSIACEGSWKTPLGDVVIAQQLAMEILNNSNFLEEDQIAHTYEHSIEVQLPLLQKMMSKPFEFVPIILAPGDNLVYKDISRAIADTIAKASGSVTLIASSDLTHYEHQESANKKDRAVIEAILALDENTLGENVTRLNISMCGFVPVMIALLTAKIMGAKESRLIHYRTSGDISGDYSSVVGYAGITIS